MKTGKNPASLAGKQLANPKSTKAEKSVAGSVLSEAKGTGRTSPKDASKAAKQLVDPKSTKAEKSVAGSDLTHAKGAPKKAPNESIAKKKWL
jgi:hypothetical protein